MKRLHILTILAALTLLLCCLLPTKAEAATSGSYTYTVSGGKATITGYSTSISGKITIPSTLGGYPVTSIGEWAFYNCSRLTSITIPDSVTKIGYAAFSCCSKLTAITIPDSVTSIGSDAFSECSSLTSITIPDSVTSIGFGAFSSCSSLTAITIPDGVTSIEDYTFSDCRSLTAITIPDSVTWIGVSAFASCRSLTSITIPDSVTSIGSGAFVDCSSLTSVTIGNSVTSIGSYAFSGCSSLTGITIPNSVTSISYSAFSGCSSLTGIWVDTGNKNYSSDENGVLFNKEKTNLIQAPGAIITYTIPDSVTSIGSDAFVGCSSLTSITIGNRVTSIGEGAFNGCSSLTSITIPDSVTSIGGSAFYKCSSLTAITIPDSVTSIGRSAFSGCSSLKHVAYTGTQSRWSSISVGSNNTTLENATRHYETAFQTLDNCMETSTYCPVCQITLTRTEKPDGSHAFAPVTCTTPKTCTICFVTEGEALGHSGQWIELVPATCTTDGINARICTICGETETETVVATGHSYSAVVTAPTCTEKGYTTKTCATCGEISVTDYVDALGHSYSAVVVEPTCTEQGYTTKTCSVCGDVTIEYTPAKGHGWSAWITTVKPTCTTEGARMRFCNCGTRETEVIAKLPHSLENYICTVCGELDYANTVLTGDVQVNWNLTQDLYIDLAGFDLSGTIITNGYKVYGMDSTTDGYTCDNIGYFTCVDEKGNFIVPERIYTEGEKQYMAICEEDCYSFHRFFVGITHMSLEPEVVGLGYKSAIYGDEMVFAELAATKAFAFCVQLEGYNPVYRRFDRNELTSGNPITLRIRNYDVENYSEHNLYAQVSLTLNDGTVIETEQVSLTFRWLTEQVNENYTDYTADQLASFSAMLQAFEIVKKWNIPNLI